jgi:hypothetical protein
MIINNNTILVSNFELLFNLLNNKELENSYNCKYIYEKKIAIQHLTKINNININRLRIWSTYSLFDWWYDKYDNCGKNFIGCVDYILHDNYIKINYLNINDSQTTNLYINPLDLDDAEDLIRELINFIKLVAFQENKKKIILDVHENLRLYNKYYYNLGFEVTKRKSEGNPYWVEIEINL